jgi:hypothetical protein
LLSLGDVEGLRALPALGHLVGHLIALFEGPEPAALYGGVVDEDVLASVVRLDEAVPSVLIEPPHRSLGHAFTLTFLSSGPASAQNPLSTSLRSIRVSSDLKEIGAMLDESEAALIVVGETTIERALDEATKRAKKAMKKQVRADAKEIEKLIDTA